MKDVTSRYTRAYTATMKLRAPSTGGQGDWWEAALAPFKRNHVLVSCGLLCMLFVCSRISIAHRHEMKRKTTSYSRIRRTKPCLRPSALSRTILCKSTLPYSRICVSQRPQIRTRTSSPARRSHLPQETTRSNQGRTSLPTERCRFPQIIRTIHARRSTDQRR